MAVTVDEQLSSIEREPNAEQRFVRLRGLSTVFPDAAQVWLHLAHSALEVQHVEPAYAALEHALCLDLKLSKQVASTIPQVLAERVAALNYVNHLDLLGDQVAMLDQLRRLSLRYPDYTPVLFNYAVALARSGSPDLARQIAHRTVEQSPITFELFPAQLRALLRAPGAHSAPADPRIGTVVGGYRVLRTASTAPSHVLYDAVHSVDQTAVTLRHLLHTPPDKARALFDDQADADAEVRDDDDARRHLVRALGRVDDGGVPLQVLERIHGRTVYEAFEVPPDDPDIGLNVVWLVARAAAELHERIGFLHGRLGPDNVLFLDDNVERPVRLLDTGLNVRMRAGLRSLPAHLAPDHAPSPRADVYGLGVLLHYVLTGTVPTDDRIAVERLPAAKREQLGKIIAKCLAPPDERYATANLVAGELESLFVTATPAVGPGSVLDEWRIDALINSDGGCANVYRAEHRHIPGRVAALKVLNRLCICNREVRHRFELEASITPRHPAIIEIWPRSSFLIGTPYYAMELLDGESLRLRLDAGRIAPTSALDWALELAEALTFAHERGVVHRDLKPENVFVLKPGGPRHVKLLDFGIAKVRSSSLCSQLGVAVGTPAYMAPEQLACNEQPEQRAKIDVYALGVLLVEMLTGVHTLGHTANSPYRPIVLTDHFAFLESTVGTVRKDLEYVLGTMTAERPEQRPSMQSAFTDLQQIAHRVPGTSARRTEQVSRSPAPRTPAQEESAMTRSSGSFGKVYTCEQGHRYTEGTDDYLEMMRHPKNWAMREPWICPTDGSALVIDGNRSVPPVAVPSNGGRDAHERGASTVAAGTGRRWLPWRLISAGTGAILAAVALLLWRPWSTSERALHLKLLSAQTGQVGVAVQVPFTVEPAEAADALTLGVNEGSLPPGVTLDGPAKRFAGTPTSKGSFPVKITGHAKGYKDAVVSMTFTIGEGQPLPAVDDPVLVGSNTMGGIELSRSPHQPVWKQAALSGLQIKSTPPGAAVFVGGEPTGLTTPTTLTGITKEQLLIRLQLPNHAPATTSIDIPAGTTVSTQMTLVPLQGRLVISDLPPNASVIVDTEEYEAGEVIPVAAGKHDICIVLDGRTITQQSIETTTGDQGWRLIRGKLVRN
jgi:serine/threonine protein kinase